ncbi:hypothetical protein OC834_000421 [Tilletia horrida]|nr:hypothetical protein OC834_000421 [Tilletia horrida]
MSAALASSPCYLFDPFHPPPVMSVKEHLDESRNPSISCESESQYSETSSNPRTPEALDDASTRTSPSTGLPATPLIFRTHFVSTEAADQRNAQAAGLHLEAPIEKEEMEVLDNPFSLELSGRYEMSTSHPDHGYLDDGGVSVGSKGDGEKARVAAQGPGMNLADRHNLFCDSYGPTSPAGVALADFFRLKEQHASPLHPADTHAPPHVVEERITAQASLLAPAPIGKSAEGSGCETKGSSLLSPAPISEARRAVDSVGPSWTLNDRWSAWEQSVAAHHQQRHQHQPATSPFEPRKLSNGRGVLPYTSHARHMGFHGQLIKPVPVRAKAVRPKIVMLEGDADSFGTPLTTSFMSSTNSSPTSVVVAAQRRAWLEHFYPDGDLKQRPHLVQLANLRLPSSEEVDPPAQTQATAAGGLFPPTSLAPGKATTEEPRLSLGSPFKLAQDGQDEEDDPLEAVRILEEAIISASESEGDEDDEGEEDSDVEEDKENCPLLPPKSPMAALNQMSFSTNRAGRKRAQSTFAAGPPPPLVFIASRPPATIGIGRTRANSDTSIPSASSMQAHFHSSEPMDMTLSNSVIGGALSQLKAVQSLLDEQVLTPTTARACAPDAGLATLHGLDLATHEHKSERGPSPSPAFGRARTQTSVTFAEDPVFPVRAATSPLPFRFNSTGSALGRSAPARLSRLLKNRLQGKDAARTAYVQLSDEAATGTACSGAADDISFDGEAGGAQGWKSARCSLEEWEMMTSPYKGPSSDVRVHSRTRSYTAGADDTDAEGYGDDADDTQTECSTAPSTPTIPAHLITRKQWRMGGGKGDGSVPTSADVSPGGSDSGRSITTTTTTTTALSMPLSSPISIAGSLSAGGGLNKPLPLPRVESDAVLRLRPSLGDLRRQMQVSARNSDDGHHSAPYGNKRGDGAAASEAGEPTAAAGGLKLLPFRELKASWEARARQGASNLPSSRMGSPRIGISVEAENLECLAGH